MGKYVSLELAKKHVRADDFTEDDEYLSYLVQSAEAQVIAMTQAGEAALVEKGGGEDLPLPLKQAILLLVGHWYNQREGTASGNVSEVPFGIRTLVYPFRKLNHEK